MDHPSELSGWGPSIIHHIYCRAADEGDGDGDGDGDGEREGVGEGERDGVGVGVGVGVRRGVRELVRRAKV